MGSARAVSPERRTPDPLRARRGAQNRTAGGHAEAQAEAFLRRQGYRIVARNLRLSRGEIDILAVEGRTLCFVEIKAVASGDAEVGGARVDAAKRRRLALAAIEYLSQQRLGETPARFDLVTVAGAGDPPALTLHRDVFQLDDAVGEEHR